MISYYYVNPTGNITLLVDSPVPPAERVKIAEKLMRAEPEAEQVGFIDGRNLNMAGGEFCGNATLSAAAVYCLKNNLDSAKVDMTVSGADCPVKVTIQKTDENKYSGEVEMPLPESISETRLNLGGKSVAAPVVNFASISHIILTQKAERAECEREIVRLCRELHAGGLGIMLVEGDKLTPLVYVPEPETLVWESSCASGTTAAGIYFASLDGEAFSGEFTEPGGKLGITVAPGSRPLLKGRAETEGRRNLNI
ncbi:MAG: hypothetical protein IKN56_04760 [Clostridia bacterium]|nr:hypothetical protein [Clostridia bacterium]MBR6360448.1 hypothetical protein [Clostridia bacterium]